MDKKSTSIVVASLGALMLLASLTADLTGFGDQIAFGPAQKIGTLAGIIVVGIGAFLYRKNSAGS